MSNYTGISHSLPDIDTVWTDKTAYPYALIIKNFGGMSYGLLLSTAPFTYVETDMDNLIFGTNVLYLESESLKNGIYSDTWSPITESLVITNNRIVVWGTAEIWTSHDILNEDGTLYMRASDYKAPPQDFYIVKNGVGQKQDVYLRVGGKSVKMDEYLI